ncbi:hypothetical protein BKA64DRAFT_750507 [Cadophora sp. MPI-SDFR-AT-0126]|nr:hypothetical protein BKA64DRAFT_750507 [Leotiomycetes sp. MPI-SDFR-AT-0126]
MGELTSLPAEVSTQIFEACDDIVQLLALASTCKKVQSVWVSHSSTIIWAFGKSNIRCFDLALMVVRATTLVLKASQANSPPPTFPSMSALSGKALKPNVTELKEVLDMQHLVRCVEYMYFNSTRRDENLFGVVMLPSECRRGTHYGDDEEAWKDRFYRAMYQLLLAGPVLAAAYDAPFWGAKNEGNIVFLEHCTRKLSEENGMLDEMTTGDGFNEMDAEYARQFPVYNYDIVTDYSSVGKWREKEYESLFSPFAEWLVNEANARERRNPEPEFTDPKVEFSQFSEVTNNRGAVQDLMCLLAGYEHLICKFTNVNGKKGYGFRRHTDPSSVLPVQWKKRKVTIVLFGVFRVEEVTMPSIIENTVDVLLNIAVHPSLQDTDQASFDMSCIIDFIDQHSCGPDFGNQNPYPPAMFQLWFFTLRRHLHLGFLRGAFWQWYEGTVWEQFGTGDVFREPRWAIVQPYVEGKVSWYLGSELDDEA